MPQSQRIAIWQRLGIRFLIEPASKDRVNKQILSTIQPITDADELLRTVLIKSSGALTPAGTGWLDLLTVPTRKRWRLFHLFVGGSVGTTTFTNVGIKDGSSQDQLTSQTAASTLYYDTLKPMPLDTSWILNVYVNAYVSGTVTGYALIEEEDAY